MSYQVPNHPGQPRPNPFAGADGTNPFADSASSPASAAESADANPYAASGSSVESVAQPQAFETILSHRGGTVFWLGLIGLLGATVGWLCLLVWMPVPLFALCLSIPAWLMGRNDLRAMKAGAMDNSGWRQTRAGYVMGMIGSLIAGVVSALLIGFVIYAIVVAFSVSR